MEKVLLASLRDIIVSRGNLTSNNEDDLDNLKSGVYGVNKTYYPGLEVPVDFGTLIHIDGVGVGRGGNPKIQIAISHNGANMYIRAKWISTVFPWREISLV